MKTDTIRLHTKQELLTTWARDRELFCPDAKTPPLCLRCGKPLRRHYAENALSRALRVFVCPECGTDEALRDASGEVLPISQWHAVQNNRLIPYKEAAWATLTPQCSFSDIFSGPKKQLPLNNIQYPVSLIAYSRSDYDGHRWWTGWFDDETDRPPKELAQEIDRFQAALFALPEFRTIWDMKRMCKLYAQPTSDQTEFNLYSQTERFYVWLRLITRERDYNLYCYFYRILDDTIK